jgi:hypothetical protein
VTNVLDCQRCGELFEKDGLLLNHKTKFAVKVIQLCPRCCRDCVIGLHRNGQRANWTYLEKFQRNFIPKK